jgi:predicted ATPase/DNA-binding SARP family transcriptional activator
MLRVELFGGFRLYRDGAPVRDFTLRKAQLLLAFLLLHRHRPHPRSMLAGLLWGETAEPQAKSHLRKLLYVLRRTLEGPRGRFGSYFLTEGETIRFNSSSAFSCDVDDFNEACHAAQVGAPEKKTQELGRALAQYQGPLLAGFYDDWVLIEQDHFKDAYVHTLRLLIRHLQSLGDYRRAIEWSQKALRENALQEELHRTLMECYVALGDRASALAQYRELESLLNNELGIHPLPETRALLKQVLEPSAPSVRLAVASPTQHNLPLPLTRFVGRRSEIGEIKSLLRENRLLTLTGAGGSGKTRLALRVAHELLSEYADGVWFADLSSETKSELLGPAIAQALGIQDSQELSPQALLAKYLKPRRLLLILDNCEHLVKGCAALAQSLLQSCPTLTIMTTSREVLGVLGERVWIVPSLSDEDAIELFQQRVIAASSPFDQANARSVITRICRRLEGLPLAIELAAGRAKVLSLGQIAERLHDALSLLSPENAMVSPDHHRTMRAALDWSYRLLTEAEQALLRRLAVFAGDFSLSSATALGADVDWQESEILNALHHLVNKSLVSVLYSDYQVRYRLNEIIRQYGQEKLRMSGELPEISRRHLDFFLGLAERTERELTGPHQALWLDRLEQEHDNLCAALDWGLTQEAMQERSLRLAGALSRFWLMRRDLREARERLSRVLERAPQLGTTSLYARVLRAAGKVAQLQKDWKAATDHFEAALTVYRQKNDEQGMAAALHNLGVIAAEWQTHPERARALLQEALSLARNLGDAQGIAAGLAALGTLALKRGDYGQAQRLFEESLGRSRERGDQREVAAMLNNLGVVAQTLGQLVKARHLFEESLAIRHQLKSPRDIALALQNLGGLSLTQGDYIASRTYYEEHLRLVESAQDSRGIAVALSGLGSIAGARGEAAEAGEYFHRVLTLQEQQGLALESVRTLRNLGDVAYYRGDYAQARSYIEKSQAALEPLALQNQKEVAQLQHSLGKLAQAEGDLRKAQQLYKTSLQLLKIFGDQHLIVEGLESMASLFAVLRVYRSAARLLGATEARRRQIGAPLHPVSRAEQEKTLLLLRAQLDPSEFAELLRLGQAMKFEQALEFALSLKHL